MIVPGVVVVSPQKLRAWLEAPDMATNVAVIPKAQAEFLAEWRAKELCEPSVTDAFVAGWAAALQRLSCYDKPGHPLDGKPLLRRETMLLEVVCDHGIGHPIEESVAQMERIGPVGARGTWDMHGCDGCCSGRFERGRWPEAQEA